jgi:putative endonuclease
MASAVPTGLSRTSLFHTRKGNPELLLSWVPVKSAMTSEKRWYSTFVIPANAGTQLDKHMHADFSPTVYLLASQRNGTLYAGVTSNLLARIQQHRDGLVRGFTQKYGIKLLVWFEQHPTMESAITREKRIKKWNRA